MPHIMPILSQFCWCLEYFGPRDSEALGYLVILFSLDLLRLSYPNHGTHVCFGFVIRACCWCTIVPACDYATWRDEVRRTNNSHSWQSPLAGMGAQWDSAAKCLAPTAAASVCCHTHAATIATQKPPAEWRGLSGLRPCRPCHCHCRPLRHSTLLLGPTAAASAECHTPPTPPSQRKTAGCNCSAPWHCRPPLSSDTPRAAETLSCSDIMHLWWWTGGGGGCRAVDCNL